MPRYLCRVGMPDRRVEVRELRANDVASLARRLEEAGQDLLDARRILPWQDLWSPAPPRDEVALALGQVATLGRAGLPLEGALRAVADAAENEALKSSLGRIADSVAKGTTFSRAIESEPDLFDAILARSVAAAPTPESVHAALERRAAALLELEELRRKIQGALAYPALLLGLSTVVLSYLVVYVVPSIGRLFEESHTPLPRLTRITLSAVAAARAGAFWIVPLAGVIAGLAWYLRDQPIGERVADRVLGLMPTLGTAWRSTPWTRWAQTLADALSAGVRLPQALRMAAGVVARPELGRRLSDAAKFVEEGAPLPEALARAGAHSPGLLAAPLSLPLADTGLADALRAASRAESARVLWALGRFSRSVEPALVLSVGLVVAFIVISLYLPILSLVETL